MYRLIIADDEPIECRALEHKIQSLADNVELLASVYDGVSLLKSVEEFQPDIAIVDINMPGLNGLEAVELLKMKNLELKIIINSSYSDYSYMQKALQLGASDYLLKPGTKEALLGAIRKVCGDLKKEKQEQKERCRERRAADSLYTVASEKWLLSLVLGNPDEKCWNLLKEQEPEIKNGGVFTIWRVCSNEVENFVDAEKIKNRIAEKLQEFCHCIGLEYKREYYFFLWSGGRDETKDHTGDFMDHVWNELQREGVKASIGISRFKIEQKQFTSGIYEARTALQEQKKPGLTSFCYQEQRIKRSVLHLMAEPCARLLVHGNITQCIDRVKAALMKEQSTAYIDIDALKIQTAVFLMELEQELLRLSGKGQNQAECDTLWENFGRICSLQGMLEWLEQELQKCFGRIGETKEGRNQYIEKSLIYIYEHYSEDISLEDVAGAIGISSFYLSRLFKQEKHVTFVELLTAVRIRSAIQMMRENKKNMREICRDSGYSSMTYFYRVFKKTTGYTVGEMRKYLVC